MDARYHYLFSCIHCLPRYTCHCTSSYLCNCHINHKGILSKILPCDVHSSHFLSWKCCLGRKHLEKLICHGVGFLKALTINTFSNMAKCYIADTYTSGSRISSSSESCSSSSSSSSSSSQHQGRRRWWWWCCCWKENKIRNLTWCCHIVATSKGTHDSNSPLQLSWSWIREIANRS